MTTLRVAIVGAGPAGIYAADILAKSGVRVDIDVLEYLPAPYGLVRYGVAPDHPRIKEIVTALEAVLTRPNIRLLGNVRYGTDLKLEDLQAHYDAVVFATGAREDRDLGIPGEDLPGSFGAADFVSWYDAHPDAPRDWPLTAKSVAVLGAGNVALDVARVLAKSADDLLTTDIPDNVHAGLRDSQVTDVHVFARRGPAQVKFSPMELRELAHVQDVDVIVHPEGFELDEASMHAAINHRQTKMVVDTLQNWVHKEPKGHARRLHLHFLEQPVELRGTDGVDELLTERTELCGDGSIRGTGQVTHWPVQAVYRAVGYRSTALPDLPFDERTATIPHRAGRVLDLDDAQLPGVYVTGWIKRGPIGLIGHTKGDAGETIASLLEDLAVSPTIRPDEAAAARPDLVDHLTELGVDYTTWADWERLDEHELSLGRAAGRTRIKLADRDEMLRVSRA